MRAAERGRRHACRSGWTSIRAIPAGHDRRGAPAAGAGQHPRQRHPGRRRPPPRRAGCGPAPSTARRMAIVVMSDNGRRDRAGGPAAALRSLLHDPADRNRHRSCDLPQHHRRPGRADHRRQRARSRHGRAHRAPARPAEPHDQNNRLHSARRRRSQDPRTPWRRRCARRATKSWPSAARARRSGCSARGIVRRPAGRQPDAGADRPRPDPRAGLDVRRPRIGRRSC